MPTRIAFRYNSVSRLDLPAAQWCGMPLEKLRPHGLTGQARFTDWLAGQVFYRPKTLRCKVLVNKN